MPWVYLQQFRNNFPPKRNTFKGLLYHNQRRAQTKPRNRKKEHVGWFVVHFGGLLCRNEMKHQTFSPLMPQFALAKWHAQCSSSPDLMASLPCNEAVAASSCAATTIFRGSKPSSLHGSFVSPLFQGAGPAAFMQAPTCQLRGGNMLTDSGPGFFARKLYLCTSAFHSAGKWWQRRSTENENMSRLKQNTSWVTTHVRSLLKKVRPFCSRV